MNSESIECMRDLLSLLQKIDAMIDNPIHKAMKAQLKTFRDTVNQFITTVATGA